MDASSMSDMVTLNETEPDEARHSWQDDEIDEEASLASVETTVNDILDLEVDATMMLSSINTLLETLESIIGSLVILRDQTSEEDVVRDSIQTTSEECRKLYGQLTELEGVVSAYVGRHETGQSNPESRIDPSLYKWSSDCMIFLLELNAYTERLRSANEPDYDAEDWEDAFIDKEEADEDTSFEEYQMRLVIFNGDLAGFIPILKVDLNEHHTSHMPIPTAIPSTSTENPTWNRYQDSFSTVSRNSQEMLRRDMYALKDALSESRTHLIKQIRQLPYGERSGAEVLKEKLHIAAAAITEMLTNHASEWLEATLAGKLSYGEFMQLPLTRINEYTHQIARFSKDIDVDQSSVHGNHIGIGQIEIKKIDDALGSLLVLLKVKH